MAFRVLQEALTNVIKHAGPSRADVSIHYRAASVEIGITDDGAGARGAAVRGDDASGGHGLVGMRERLALFGGTLCAAPRRTGGFEVRASIPRTEGQGS